MKLKDIIYLKERVYLLVFCVSLCVVFNGYKAYMENKTSNLYLENLGSYDNLYEMPDVFINSVVENIVNSYLVQDLSYLENNRQYFTEEALEKMSNSIEKVMPVGIYTTDDDWREVRVREMNVEKSYGFINLDVMCNFVLEHPRTSFSGVYLLQLLVNYEGKIYGFNLWQY